MSPERVDPLLAEWQRRSLRIGAACVAFCALTGLLGSALIGSDSASSFVPSMAQFWRSYLIAYLFCLSLGLGALVVLMLHALTGGVWGAVLRPFLEAAVQSVPILALLFLPMLLGLSDLYPWARWQADEIAGSAHLEQKAQYLNVNFFAARAILYLCIWSGLSWRLSRQYNAFDADQLRARRNFSAVGLILFALTCTFASIDWIMSLEPLWYSSIFGMILAAMQVLGGFAFAIVMVTRLGDDDRVREIATPERLHDLGKLLLAFVMLWAYVAFSQFLLIWAGNLPEEITYYLKRFEGGWLWLALALVFFKFATPFLMLLSRQTKRTAPALGKVALLLVVMTYLDFYWMIAPAYFPYQGFRLHWMSVLLLVGLAGLVAPWYLRDLPHRLEEYDVEAASVEVMPDD